MPHLFTLATGTIHARPAPGCPWPLCAPLPRPHGDITGYARTPHPVTCLDCLRELLAVREAERVAESAAALEEYLAFTPDDEERAWLLRWLITKHPGVVRDALTVAGHRLRGGVVSP